jgi:hypothetical protein
MPASTQAFDTLRWCLPSVGMAASGTECQAACTPDTRTLQVLDPVITVSTARWCCGSSCCASVHKLNPARCMCAAAAGAPCQALDQQHRQQGAGRCSMLVRGIAAWAQRNVLGQRSAALRDRGTTLCAHPPHTGRCPQHQSANQGQDRAEQTNLRTLCSVSTLRTLITVVDRHSSGTAPHHPQRQT